MLIIAKCRIFHSIRRTFFPRKSGGKIECVLWSEACRSGVASAATSGPGVTYTGGSGEKRSRQSCTTRFTAGPAMALITYYYRCLLAPLWLCCHCERLSDSPHLRRGCVTLSLHPTAQQPAAWFCASVPSASEASWRHDAVRANRSADSSCSQEVWEKV